MLYYIYIGTNRIIIDHLSKITGGMFVAVSSSQKAAKLLTVFENGITYLFFMNKQMYARQIVLRLVIYVNVIPGFISLLLLKH